MTYSKDGNRRFGDHIMLFNAKAEGFLGTNLFTIVTDVFDKILNTEESYHISAVKKIHACARSVFIL